jgi:hypothetical protein
MGGNFGGAAISKGNDNGLGSQLAIRKASRALLGNSPSAWDSPATTLTPPTRGEPGPAFRPLP